MTMTETKEISLEAARAMLVAYGHSGAKAFEIALDAKRGDDFSRRYIAMVASLAEGRA
jgi:glycine cleavage system aminomethyltransferase T